MADLIFLSGYPTQQETSDIDRVQVDKDGNTVFENEAYRFYATFPSLNLPPVSSNKPILMRSFGWINGG
jgi:hypothetical protein